MSRVAPAIRASADPLAPPPVSGARSPVIRASALLALVLVASSLFGASNQGNPRWIPLDGEGGGAAPNQARGPADPSTTFETTQRRIDFENRKEFPCALFGGGAFEWSGRVRFPQPSLEFKVLRNGNAVRTNLPLTELREIQFRAWKPRVMEEPKYAFVAGETELTTRGGRSLVVREPLDLLARLWLEPEGEAKGKGKYLYTWYVDYLVKGVWMNSRLTNSRRLTHRPPDEVVTRIVFQQDLAPTR